MFQKFIEDPAGVERARIRFRMELHRHERQFVVNQAFIGAIVAIFGLGLILYLVNTT